MVTKMVTFLIVYIHCYACLWWQIVKVDQQWIPISGIVSGNYSAIYEGSTSTIRRYILCVHTSMQMMMGVDVLPQKAIEVLVAGCGNFLGAIINANIFGELAMILSGIDRADKVF